MAIALSTPTKPSAHFPIYSKTLSLIRGLMQKRRFDIIYLIALAALALAVLFPIKTRIEREVTLAMMAICWLAPWLAFRSKLLVGAVWIPVTAVVAWLFLAPTPQSGKPTVPRDMIVSNLEAYNGALYIWGGEARLGIDCSGLIRRGMIDSCYQMGIERHDPRLMRMATSMWWNDVSAEQLGQGYDGRTQFLFNAKSLNNLDYSKILPGDFAVTSSGLHTLAYIGNRTWIEADPQYMSVVKVSAPSTNTWFFESMKIMRWTNAN